MIYSASGRFRWNAASGQLEELVEGRGYIPAVRPWAAPPLILSGSARLNALAAAAARRYPTPEPESEPQLAPEPEPEPAATNSGAASSSSVVPEPDVAALYADGPDLLADIERWRAERGG